MCTPSLSLSLSVRVCPCVNNLFFHFADYSLCRDTILGQEYTGNRSFTSNFRRCQAWASDSPHNHDKHFHPENFCYNSDTENEGPFCYTMDPGDKWTYCNIPYCPGMYIFRCLWVIYSGVAENRGPWTYFVRESCW